MFSFINLLFTAPLLVIVSFAAYFDIKKSIIPNKLVFGGFLYGLFIYFLLFAYNILFLESAPLFEYIVNSLLNGFIAVGVGFLIWRLKFWEPGDGKLFGLCGFLLPLHFYSGYYIDYFPAFSLLINIFAPLLILLALKAIVESLKNIKKANSFLKDRLLNKSNLKNYLKTVATFLTDLAFIMIIIRFIVFALQGLFSIPPNGFLVFFLLIAFMVFFSFVKNNFKMAIIFKYLTLVVFLGDLIVQGDYQAFIGFVATVFVFGAFFGFFRYGLLFYVKSNEVRKIKATDVESGMVLTKEWKEFLTKKISNMDGYDNREHFEEVKAGGLTEEQAEALRELFADDPKYNIEICSTTPFAPFMLISVLISITTSSSFVPLINNFFQSLISF